MRLAILMAATALAVCLLAFAGFAPNADAARIRYTPLRTPGVDISCNAQKQSVCDATGCHADDDGMIPVALSYDGRTGHGEFCIGEGCTDMTLAAMPASSSTTTAADAEITGAVVVTHGPEGYPPIAAPYFDGVAAFKRDGSAFRLVRGDMIWVGTCAPAAHE